MSWRRRRRRLQVAMALRIRREISSPGKRRGRGDSHGRPFEPLSRGLRALAARPARFLGRSGGRHRLDRKAENRVRSERRRLRPLVRRRRLQHLLQRGRPPRRCRARRADGDHLRLAARRAKTRHHLSSPADRDPGARRHAARPRRAKGRPGHSLYADGAGGGVRHAGLRAHRRHPLGGVRRFCRARIGDADRRRQAESDPLGKLRHRARPHRRL